MLIKYLLFVYVIIAIIDWHIAKRGKVEINFQLMFKYDTLEGFFFSILVINIIFSFIYVDWKCDIG